jgi:hypothetical protein
MKNAAIIAMVLLGASAARADVPVEVGAFAGGHFFSPSTHLGYKADNPHFLDDTGTFGFRFALEVLPRLSLESELALAPTQASHAGDGVLTFGWRGHALVHVLTGRFRPFVLVGGGGISASSANPNLVREDTRGEIHAGLGLKVDIRCNWGVRVEGRVQFEQATAGIYFTEDWDVFAGVYGRFGKAVAEKCHK